ncbi:MULTISPECIES: hypothetical protein [unclassified Streptomyces]|uniref:hypothetical protein n=1 Tax=unclassified Streptomyces TaxID=2593676 RepID=UPI0022B66C88|nr:MULTISPECIES: hypothetical protein [unclassified Streptomyces]MCZ7417084.1 hypothetical protein [Streptomyces sp. WMMC897]MCZ7433088.1 hypothetical protein [Streptomyces sp. WMMC1477]
MTERRRAFRDSGRPGQPSGPEQEDNPFAPPPEGAPDQPWRPRYPQTPPSGPGPGADHDSGSGSGSDSGAEGQDGNGDDESARRKWGSQWSSRQPGRQSGGFGGQGGNGSQGSGPEGPGGRPDLRWDPRDPAQRHARYALLSGMWGLFLAAFGLLPLGLLLGALGLHWGISALRGAPGVKRAEDGQRTAVADLNGSAGTPADDEQTGRRALTRAAVPGVVLSSLALLIVAGTYTFQLVNKDYYDCVEDALTTAAREQCEDFLPEPFRDNNLLDITR